MFREMRRTAQALTREACEAILTEGSNGILAVHGDNGYPYTVPLSYIYQDGKIFFHCARQGHKIDSLLREDKVSFCVIARDRVVPALFATDYLSVVVFGRAHIVEEDETRRQVLKALGAKYAPGLVEEGEQEIAGAWNRVCIVCIDVEHMTGKQANDSVRKAGG